MDKIKGISLCSSAGIGELLLDKSNIDIICANELIEKRADCYKYLHKQTKMLLGSIQDSAIKKQIIDITKENNAKFLLATPPCQGVSTLGKNKKQQQFEKDRRNFLIFDIIDIVDSADFDYVLIENVPRFLEMKFPYNNQFLTLNEILEDKYNHNYIIETQVLNAKDYGISQSRPRAIIKMYKKGLKWKNPKKQKEIPLKDAIGYLPSLESGEKSNIKWHNAKIQNSRAVEALMHTPTGRSALANEVYYPKKENGERIKGFHNTFKRMNWNEPAPARTTFCGSMSSHNNVHPGRLKSDGTYSDARVLTLLETFIVHSIPKNIDFPKNATDTFIRTMIGESVPPLLLYKIISGIGG